jgi:glycine dehydrogenase subunit 2
MKYNPKRNDALTTLAGFRHVHPSQPAASVPGLWQMLFELQSWIAEITGMDQTSLSPAAGAHGEFAGLLMIRRYFESQGEERPIILIPDSAHGTNPSSATMSGFRCRMIPTTAAGLFDLDSFAEHLSPQVAAIMMTNPSTLGLFERNIMRIARMAKDNGSLLYYDGANLNALIGVVRPGDMGFDVVHVNTHKTLSTPHGGGGPGAGPVACKAFLAPYLPEIVVEPHEGGYLPRRPDDRSIGRIKAYSGHIGVLLRAYGYILTMGPEGLKEVAQNAVLNANYLQHRLSSHFPAIYDHGCLHECLLSGDRLLTSTMSFAKRLIDYGIHPPTMLGAGCVYFPGDLKSAMLIEPTESESKPSLDAMVAAFQKVFLECQSWTDYVEEAPYSRKTGKILPQSADTERDSPCVE